MDLACRPTRPAMNCWDLLSCKPPRLTWHLLSASPTPARPCTKALAGSQPLVVKQDGVGSVSLRQAYTFSDFHYRDDSRFATTVCRASHSTTTRRRSAMTTRMAWANTRGLTHGGGLCQHFYASSYTLWGATLGYASPSDPSGRPDRPGATSPRRAPRRHGDAGLRRQRPGRRMLHPARAGRLRRGFVSFR